MTSALDKFYAPAPPSHASGAVPTRNGSKATLCQGVFVPFNELKREETEYLWEHRIPRNCLTIVAGEQGGGKSFFLADLSARLSVPGRKWPDQTDCPTGTTIIFSTEDSFGNGWLPRCTTAGADVSKIIGVRAVTEIGDDEEKSFDLQRHMAVLEQAMHLWDDVCLFILDPITEFVGGKCNIDKEVDVRRVIGPLNRFAQDNGVAIVGIRHLNKGVGDNPSALARVGNATAWTSIPRAVLLCQPDADDHSIRYLANLKNNYGPPAPTLSYTICGVDNPRWKDEAEIRWNDEPIDISAKEILMPTKKRETSPALDEAKEAVHVFLIGVNDWTSRENLWAYCRKEGASRSTFEKALREMKSEDLVESVVDRSGVGENGQRGQITGTRLRLTDKGRGIS